MALVPKYTHIFYVGFYCTRLEDSTAVQFGSTLLWGVRRPRLVFGYRRFGAT